MIVNYFRIAIRHLFKNRIFSAINLFGLTLGFLCFTMLSLYVYDELSFDKFHKDSERIYRVIQHETLEDGTTRNVMLSAARVGPEAAQQIPEVEEFSRMYAMGRITMGNEPAARDYEVTRTTDPNFFQVFNFPFVEGDPASALAQTDGIVVSESHAKKFFGNGPYLGKRLWSSLERDDKPFDLIVTGVFKDLPKNSHLVFDIVFAENIWRSPGNWNISHRFENYLQTDWTSNNFVTYIKLKPGTNAAAVEEKMTSIVKNNYPKDHEFRSIFTLQPLAVIHTGSHDLQGSAGPTNSIKPFYIYMFGIVAVLILGIACLNYMNLSTASAFRRVREIGTRKALGAMKSQLISQFTGEAVILSIVAMVVAVALLQVLLPFANQFSEKEMSLGMLPTGWMAGLVGVILLSGILSATYPAFIISRVSAVEAFKKDVRIGSRSVPMRKILVASQFAISIMMISCTIVIYQQVNYLRTKDVGFQKDNLVVIDINSRSLRRNFQQVKAEFASVPEVQSITASTRVPGEWKSFPIATVKPDGQPQTTEMIFVGIDNDFLSTFQIDLLDGRNFMPGESDSTKVILTEQGAKDLGLANPIGTMIEVPTIRWGGSRGAPERPYRAEIIGVAADFHFESFRHKMMPVIFGAANTQIHSIDYYTVRVNTPNLPATIEKLKAVNLRVDPVNPLEYTFLDDEVFNSFYRMDEKRGQIFLVFSAVIICIASLGLFALVSYSIESRMKEIGVRKVLGATVSNIVSLVSKEFVVLVVISGVIAVPAAWYFMNAWLRDFEYRVGLGAGVFILALVVALVIAFTTICFRAIRAGRSNPVNSLRSE
ncbi:MAG TPA: ABC transporter permease [Cyclobacteriaceae bacterium]|nr:ABC transporter permease [Cyclobacteriaceae bacterium]